MVLCIVMAWYGHLSNPITNCNVTIELDWINIIDIKLQIQLEPIYQVYIFQTKTLHP